MKKILFALCTLMTVSFMSQAAFATTIAVVDIQKIMQEAKAAKHVKNEIQKKRDGYQASIKKQEDELRAAEKKLVEQRSLLSPEAFQEKKEEFKKKLLKVQRDVQNKRADLDKVLKDSLGEIRGKVISIIDNLSKAKGFDMAIPRSQILHADNSLDITNDVLDKLNKELPKVKTSIK